MAKRYRNYKRINLSAPVARIVVKWLVDDVFEDHYGMIDCQCWPWEDCYRGCVNGRIGKCRGGGDCRHTSTGELQVARLVETSMHIGKKRAHLDITDDPETVKLLERCAGEYGRMTKYGDIGKVRKETLENAFLQIEEAAHHWARRSPLERLAEAGLELDSH